MPAKTTFRHGVLLAAALYASAALAGEPASQSCLPAAPFLATVQSVLDGRTFRLDDGREVWMPTIEAPGMRAAAALTSEITGRALTFGVLKPVSDRYGRTAVRALAGREGKLALDVDLVSRGLAYIGIPQKGAPADPCREALLAAEATARQNKAGLWSDPDYDTKAAHDTAAILAAKGRFAVIEGKVLSVRESGGTVYVNFGRRWSTDFTVTILKRITPTFIAAGIDLKKLERRLIRVRGFVEERDGPWIEATRPEQFEFADRR
jgi:endonuclease YncB( thermonuclease family)